MSDARPSTRIRDKTCLRGEKKRCGGLRRGRSSATSAEEEFARNGRGTQRQAAAELVSNARARRALGCMWRGRCQRRKPPPARRGFKYRFHPRRCVRRGGAASRSAASERSASVSPRTWHHEALGRTGQHNDLYGREPSSASIGWDWCATNERSSPSPSPRPCSRPEAPRHCARQGSAELGRAIRKAGTWPIE